MALRPSHVDHADGDGEHDARQNAARQVLQRAGQEHEHDGDDDGEDELRDLAPRARPFRHRRLGRAAVDHEGAAERRGGVGGREPEDVGVLVDALLVLDRIDARRRRALGDDHDEA